MGRYRPIAGAHAIDEAVVGVRLFEAVDGSMAEELTIERMAVTYRTRSYRRWKDVQGHIENILIPIVSCLSRDESGRIAVIELRCLDKFTASKTDFPVLRELVRSDCDLVPSHLFSRAEYLHVYSGWFDDVSEAGRSLVNLNIDVADDRSGGIQASILQVFSRQSAKPGTFFDHQGSLPQLVAEVFEDLHAQDKAALARLLTDDVQAEINLAGSSGLGKY
jgi:hypothetical protein